MEQYLSCWKEVGAHICKLNSSLRMSFGWLMDTHKMTLFARQNPNLKEEDGTSINIMKCPLLHIHHFFLLEWTKYSFFNLLFKKTLRGEQIRKFQDMEIIRV